MCLAALPLGPLSGRRRHLATITLRLQFMWHRPAIGLEQSRSGTVIVGFDSACRFANSLAPAW